jgi:DNA-binding MarR family transcriptional regulator
MNTIDYAMMLDLLDQDYTKTEAAKVLGCTASGVNMALKALEKKGLSNA